MLLLLGLFFQVPPLSLFLLYCLHLLHTLSSPILVLLPNFTFSMKFAPLPYPMHLSESVSLKSSVLRSESVILSVVSNSLRLLDCSLCPWDYPGKNTGVGYHLHLQGIFQTQGSNLSLPHCRKILYHLSTREAYILRVQKLNPSFLICPGLKLSCKL